MDLEIFMDLIGFWRFNTNMCMNLNGFEWNWMDVHGFEWIWVGMDLNGFDTMLNGFEWAWMDLHGLGRIMNDFDWVCLLYERLNDFGWTLLYYMQWL